MPVFSSANSSVLTRAILVSGTLAVWVEVEGPAGVVGFTWAKTDPALNAAKKATAAIARNIFMTLFVILLNLRGDLTNQLVVHLARLVCLIGHPRSGSVNCLKSAAYAEPKDALFLVKEEWKTIYDLIFPRVGIISINK